MNLGTDPLQLLQLISKYRFLSICIKFHVPTTPHSALTGVRSISPAPTAPVGAGLLFPSAVAMLVCECQILSEEFLSSSHKTDWQEIRLNGAKEEIPGLQNAQRTRGCPEIFTDDDLLKLDTFLKIKESASKRTRRQGDSSVSAPAVPGRGTHSASFERRERSGRPGGRQARGLPLRAFTRLHEETDGKFQTERRWRPGIAACPAQERFRCSFRAKPGMGMPVSVVLKHLQHCHMYGHARNTY
ncbi:PREDICTED: uncharacterized protein LOC106146891 [Chinchilla lanigera]|uniref:uncharacterized protein LOC106146891 n=1 Tax=Chinchilla lanigera TaxID=34839 RepID=UPI000698D432|nr:PREDICTED: uncharacterized protein LOC106146891 [Chinchilla lanigera]